MVSNKTKRMEDTAEHWLEPFMRARAARSEGSSGDPVVARHASTQFTLEVIR